MPKWPFCNTETSCMVNYLSYIFVIDCKIGDFAATIYSDIITKGEYKDD